jgi:nicotinamidase-related amidase
MKKALVVVDMQHELTSNPKLFNANQLVNTVNNAIQKFRTNNNPVIFIQHNNKKLVTNSPGWEIDSRLDRIPTDVIIQKKHGNAFEKTELKNLLDEMQINELLFCGISSHGCVKHSCLGSIENSFKTLLLKNGHSCWNKNAKELIEKTEQKLAEKNVKVLSSNDF